MRPDGHNLARGTIKGMSYLGDVTLYEIQLEGGQMIRVSAAQICPVMTKKTSRGMTRSACTGAPTVLLFC
jgi:hypothetical protein